MITVDRKNFSSALDRCNRIAVQKSPVPHVGHVKIDFDGSKLTYSVTDLATSLIGALSASGTAQSFTVNCDFLVNAVKNTVGEVVKLSTDKNGRIKVTGDGKRAFTGPTLPADEFPVISHNTEAPVVNVPADALLGALARVQFALASYKDARNGTDCVKLEIVDGMLTAIATNGHCLARVQDAVEVEGTITAILPRGAVSSVLGLTGATVGIYVTPNEIGFKTENEVLIERSTVTEYPAVENVIDSVKPKKTSLVTAETVLASLSAIRGADSNKNVSISFNETEMEIEGGSDDGDRYAMDTVPAVGDKSDQITFAAEYMTGALKHFANASFGFDGPNDPITISDGISLVVIMPIRR